MESIISWVFHNLYILKNKADPVPLPPWSLKSPFQKWNIYSKASFAASMVCFTIFVLQCVQSRKGTATKTVSKRTSAPELKGQTALHRGLLETLCLLLAVCMFISIPWEWVRLYQIEVAKKTTVLSEGNAHCYSREDMSLWETLKVWLYWNFSWHNDACEDYYKALLVDPFWEVNPAMAICSAVGRVILQPVELIGHVTGRSIRHMMKEIPSQWQPIIFLLVPIICITVLAVAYFRRNRKTLIVYQVPTRNSRCKSMNQAIQTRT
ncbi:chloride channel CLIC-like protein 1 [Pelodytes ibericus]